MKTNTIITLGALAGMFFTIHNAEAADCPAGFGTYDTNCDGVCALDAYVTTWTCDVSGASTVGRVAMVQDFGADHDYEAWGDVDGDKFCCAIDDVQQGGIVDFVIIGSDNADTLSFTWDSKAYNLLAAYPTAIEGNIQAGDDADLIYGSDDNSAYYSETLEGENGDDTIVGNAGDDDMRGGGAADTMVGGTGDDTMDGGAGNDTMIGGGGADTMDGGTGDDTMDGGASDDIMDGYLGDDDMSGGTGDDTMDGGDGSDEICGGGESGGDWLFESAGFTDGDVDYLWGAINVDTSVCNEGTTYWDGASGTYCVGNPLIYSPPAGCP